MMDYPKINLPVRMNEIGTLKIKIEGPESQKEVIEQVTRQGFIIIQVTCLDGICYLIRKDFKE